MIPPQGVSRDKSSFQVLNRKFLILLWISRDSYLYFRDEVLLEIDMNEIRTNRIDGTTYIAGAQKSRMLGRPKDKILYNGAQYFGITFKLY